MRRTNDWAWILCYQTNLHSVPLFFMMSLSASLWGRWSVKTSLFNPVICLLNSLLESQSLGCFVGGTDWCPLNSQEPRTMSRMSRALVALAGHLHSVPNTHARQLMFLMIPAPGIWSPLSDLYKLSVSAPPLSISHTHTQIKIQEE